MGTLLRENGPCDQVPGEARVVLAYHEDTMYSKN